MSKKLKETIKLLKNTTVPIKTIEKDTFLGVRWLYKLRDNDFDDPGIKKIERLHSYLSGLK